ncbi:MAG: hypothetical protein HKO57_09855, partial [Akkermansiaceae bacterium]|nr:hypothetical protein [Akkermansiaceae bacterium]
VEIAWDPATGHQVLDIAGGSPPDTVHRLEFSPGLTPWFPIAASASLPWQFVDAEAPFRSRGSYRIRRAPVATITPHASWKTGITLPGDPYRSDPVLAGFDQEEIRWIKFSILLDNVPAVYFQDSSRYAFHYNFANERLDPFLGIGFEAYNDLTLHPPGQEVVLGAVLFAPDRREFALEFVGQDAYPPEMLRFLFDLVDAAVTRPGDWTGFYFPTFEQAPGATANEAYFNRHGIPLGSIARWQNADACYAPGWALGRLVFVPADEIEAAYLSGDLLPDDILMTDGVPAEVPFVAGIISTVPGTPNSHVAILAGTYGVPFVYLSTQEAVDDALALAGSDVVLRAAEVFSGQCEIDVFPALGVSGTYRDEILDLKVPPPLDLTPKAASASYTMDVDTASLADIRFIGGKAANFSLLRQTIPTYAPAAMAFAFDLWDDYLAQPLPGGGTLGAEIASRLAPYTWPPNIAQIDAELNAIRDLIKDTADFSPAQQGAILAALQAAGFDPMRKIRFRSSTNVEDAGTFVGAGLYDSFSGCLQDDLDADDAGPSHCDPSKENERGVFRAMRKVYASFYNLNAYLERLRRGVDESQVGMALLVHHSFPDEFEAANGVISGSYRDYGSGRSFDGEVVTQLGAVSVTNPEGNSIPEVVTANCYRSVSYNNCSVQHQQRSSLLQLGVFSVMDWEADYLEFAERATDVAEAYSAATGLDDYTVEYEFKKLTDDSLVIKQVRQVPEAAASGATSAALVNRPVTFEVFQGEAADLFSNHNLKTLLAVETASRWLDAPGLATSFLTRSDWSYHNTGTLAQKTGPVSAWNNAAFEVRDIFGSDFAVDSWTEPSFGGGSADLELHMQLPAASTLATQPVRVAGDFRTELHAVFSVPQLTTDFSGAFTTTTTQFALLVPRVTDQPLPDGSLLQARNHTAKSGAAIAINFHWPPAPTGPVAGYTAPLQKWETTTITGLTTDPIVLQGYFSQTYRPGHHNFSEEFLFEPRLEEGISPAILSELQALDIKQIYIEFGFAEPEFMAVGFDDVVRSL